MSIANRHRTPHLGRRRTATITNAVFFMALAVTVGPAAKGAYGAVIVSQVLFAAASLACVAVLCYPGNRWARSLSGALVGFAFVWRATSVLVTWLRGDNGFIYGVFLYVGLSIIFTIAWAEMLPTRPQARAAIERLERRPVERP